MDINQLIAQLRAQIAERLTARNAHATELAGLRAVDALTPEQEARVNELRTARDGIDQEVDALRDRVTVLEQERDGDAAADRLAREVTPTGIRPAYDEVPRTGHEPRTY